MGVKPSQAGEPSKPPRQDDAAAPLWQAIEHHILTLRDPIVEAIRAYPPPITACDAQYNHLVEERTRISRELGRLQQARATQVTAPIEAVRDFIQSSPLVSEKLRALIRSDT